MMAEITSVAAAAFKYCEIPENVHCSYENLKIAFIRTMGNSKSRCSDINGQQRVRVPEAFLAH
jgi:hypothetical protein